MFTRVEGETSWQTDHSNTLLTQDFWSSIEKRWFHKHNRNYKSSWIKI